MIFKDYATTLIDERYRFTLKSAIDDWLALPQNENFLKNLGLSAPPPSYWQLAVDHKQAIRKIAVSFTPAFRWYEEILHGTMLYGFGRYIRSVAEFHGPAGLEVVSNHHAEVVCVDREDPGLPLCGRRVAMKLDNGAVLIYLNLDDITCQVGDHLARGQVFARVASFQTNGGQHTHVGVMVVREDSFKQEIWATSQLFAGYCVQSEIGRGSIFLNPHHDYVSLGIKTGELAEMRV